MRIVSGSRGGRRLKAPAGLAVRPTPDKVREALFSILGQRVTGARVLDLFAGTGAVGLEALSRGAASVLFVEQSASVARLIKGNIEALEFGDVANVWIGRLPGVLGKIAMAYPPFDIVFADPPYEKGQLDLLTAHPALSGVVSPGSTVVLEHRYSETFATAPWAVTECRRYGDTALSFLSSMHTEA
jgi:16S rRNA (guanine966-N2)-methyltransferase